MAGRKPDPDKRSTILRAAAGLFADREFHTVPVDDVAVAAGVGKGTLYLYFSTKEELFYASIVEILDAVTTEIEAAMVDREGEDALRAFVGTSLAFFWQRRPLAVLMSRYEHKRHEPGGAEWQARRDRLATLARGALQPEIRGGHLRGADAGLAVEMLFALMRAAILNHDERDRSEPAADFIVRVLLHGIAGASTPGLRPSLRGARVARSRA